MALDLRIRRFSRKAVYCTYKDAVTQVLIPCLATIVADYAFDEVYEFYQSCVSVYCTHPEWPLVTYSERSHRYYVGDVLRSNFSPKSAEVLLWTDPSDGLAHMIRIFKFAWYGRQTIDWISQQPLTQKWHVGMYNLLDDLWDWMDKTDQDYLLQMVSKRLCQWRCNSSTEDPSDEEQDLQDFLKEHAPV